jgi:hypothetical protein
MARKVDTSLIRPLCRVSADIPYSYAGEVWMPIDGSIVENIREGVYYVSNYGRFYSLYINTIMRQTLDKDGYLLIGFYTNDNKQIVCRAHRIVLQAFCPIPNPEEFEVNHKDTRKSNNCVYNLEWVTPMENVHHSMKYGARNKSFKDYVDKVNATVVYQDIPNAFYSSSNLSIEQVNALCSLLEQNELSVNQICNIIHCKKTDIYNTLYKGTYSSISCNYNISNYTKYFDKEMEE